MATEQTQPPSPSAQPSVADTTDTQITPRDMSQTPAPQTPAPQTQTPAQGDAPQAPQPQGNAPIVNNTPATPKASMHARLFDNILQTLSGGSIQVQQTDPTTGDTRTVTVPQSRRTMANSVVAGVLTSLFSGSQGRGAEPDYKPVMGSHGTMHQEQQAKAQAASDQAADRKMVVLKSNLSTLQSQLTAARLGDDVMDKQIADGSATYDLAKKYDENLGTKPDDRSIVKDNVDYHTAMQAIGDGKLGLIAVPTGKSSHLDPATGKVVNDILYSVMNPHVKVSLDEDDVNLMSATNKSWADAWKQHGGQPIEIPLSVVNAERLVRSQVNNVQSAIDTLTSDPEVAQAIGFSGNPRDLMALAQDRKYREAIQSTEAQLAAQGGTDRHYSMLDAMLTAPGGVELAQKLGIDPTKANQWLDQQHNARMSADALAKTGGIGPKSLADQDQVAALQNSIKALPEKDQKDFSSYIPEPDAEGNINMSKADLAKGQAAVNQRVAQNANLNEKNALANGDPVAAQKFANNTIEGDVNNLTKVTSMRGNSRLNAENAIHDEASKRGLDTTQFSQQALETKAKMLDDYSGNKKGSTGSQIASFNAFLGHTSGAVAAEKTLEGKTLGLTRQPVINMSLSEIGKQLTNDPDWKDYQTALVPVKNEIENFLAAGYAVKAEDAATMKEILDENETPARMTAALRRLAETADIRLAAIGQRYLDTMGTTYTNLMSADSRNTLKNLKVDSKADAVSQKLPRGWQNNQATKIDKQTAQTFYRAAGNDPVKAQELAKLNGWSF